MGQKLSDLIKVAKSPEGARPALPKFKLNLTAPKATNEDVLHGSGITKKVATVAQNQLVKNQHKVFATPTGKQDLFSMLRRAAPKPQLDGTEATADIPVLEMPYKAALEKTVEYDHSQLAAIEGIRAEQFSCLIGAAGSGKTTVVKEIVHQIRDTLSSIDLRYTDAQKMKTFAETGSFEPVEYQNKSKADFNLAICFCAFTGRAVQQMKKPLPVEYHPMCNTIHSTLGFYPVYSDAEDEDGIPIENKNGTIKQKMKFVPWFNEFCKLPYDVCVVDESGMLGIDLWQQLLAALKPTCKIILIGDINQLPPVQGRSVLGFAMINWPTFELTEIHRQALDNPIIAAAHDVLQGKIPQRVPGKFDMLSIDAGSLKAFETSIKAIKIMHRDGKFKPETDAFIVPQNIDTLGQIHFNSALVNYFNAPKHEGGVLVNPRCLVHTGTETRIFAIGDKVMILNNDRERGLTNGMTGMIVNIRENSDYRNTDALLTEFDVKDFLSDINEQHVSVGNKEDDKEEAEDVNQRQASHIVTVDFDTGEEIEFVTAGDYRKLALAYAITCHKSQGGEYPTVIILCHSANDRMLSREWLYTAITRGSERDLLLYNDMGLSTAVKRQKIKGKTLKEKAQSFNALQDRKDVRIPTLPKPRKMA